MTSLYPIFLDLTGRPSLVIGGGRVAERKITGLLEAEASVTIISPKLSSAIMKLVNSDRVKYLARSCKPGDVDGFAIVIAATDDERLNEAIFREASEKNIPVNIIDHPELCTFLVPAVVKRGDLRIAISTAGQSPALAKRLRKQLEDQFGPEYADWVRIVGEFRRQIISLEDNEDIRRLAYERLLDSDVFEKVKSHKDVDIDGLVAKFVRQAPS